MTREEAIAALEDADDEYDIEEGHGRADDILCELLTTLGYADVVAAWQKVDKWYA